MTGNLLRFDGKVAIVTGAGGGLGKEYALLLASRGASVIVNDLGGGKDGEGQSSKAADIVVKEIIQKGGKAVPNYDSVENGPSIVKTAIDNFGRVDIVINNAGILRDKSFLKLEEQDWDLVHKVHLKGAYSVTRAAWPYFREQNYGRILMTSSNAGLFGNFGQANYGSAKLGLLGLSNTLAIEGAKYNINCNTLVPVAASRLTENVLPPNILEQLQPKYVAPLVAWLVHEENAENGGCFECAGGWMGKYRLQRSAGKAFIPPDQLTIESVRDHWHEISDFSKYSFPKSIHEHMSQLLGNLNGETESSTDASNESSTTTVSRFQYSPSDVILYALGVGVSTQEENHLRYLYENDDNFSTLPTFGVLPGLNAIFDLGMLTQAANQSGVKVDPTRLVHGEQYLELFRPLSTTGQFNTSGGILEVLDKGSGALIITDTQTNDAETGEPILYNQMSLFIVGSGNFGGKRQPEHPNVRPVLPVPKRDPDAISQQATWPEQSALYRLSGDRNPLHIDPAFSVIGGFEKPILHGLCTLGFAVRHVLQQFASGRPDSFRALKCRFAGTVLPGQTVRTLMWLGDNNRVHFECEVVETGKKVITSSYVDLTTVDWKPNPSTGKANIVTVGTQIPQATVPQSNVTNGFIPPRPSSIVQPQPVVSAGPEPRSNHTMAAVAHQDDEVFFLTDPIFEEINRRLHMAKDVQKKVGEIFQFNISKSGQTGKRWILDIKSDSPTAYQGDAKQGRPSCVISISDEDMAALALGDLDPVKAFMNGRIKIKGNPMLTQKLDILFKLDSADADPGVVENNDAAVPQQIINSKLPPGFELKCKMDHVFVKWLMPRMNELKVLVPSVKNVFYWEILKNGQVVSNWTCDMKNGDGDFYPGMPKPGVTATCTLKIEDDVAVQLFSGKEDPTKAFMSGKIKISGNVLAAQKMQKIWEKEKPPSIEELLNQPVEASASSGGSAVGPTVLALSGSNFDVENIPCSGLKCDLIFNIFVNRAHEEPDFMKKLRVIFQFNITRKGKPMCVWTADNKSKPEIAVYRQPALIKPDVTITVEDEDMLKIMVGKVNPQRLFMMGKVKVKGNIMLLQKLNTLWLEYQKLGKTPELPAVVEVMMKDPIKVGLKSEAMIIDLMQRVAKLKDLPNKLPGLHQFDITKEGKIVSNWTLDFLTGRNTFYRGPANGEVSTQIQVDDTDFARLVYTQLRLQEGLNDGRVKVIKGGVDKVLLLDTLFTTPTSLKSKL